MAAGHAHVPHMNPEVFRELLLDLDGAPLQVWQGFSPGSLASYEKNITDLFLELQISDGQPYFQKFAPKVPDAQHHTARDEARLRISSQSFSNVDAIKSELDQYFSIHHPGCCGLQRENSLGGKRAVFRCTSVLQKSKAEQKQPAAAPADYKEECALFLPFRKGGQRGGGSSEAGDKDISYWKMSQQQKRGGVLGNAPVWEHSTFCVQQLPVFKTKQFKSHPLTQLAVDLNPNVTAADVLAFVQVKQNTHKHTYPL